MNLPKFHGSKLDKDHQLFIDEVRKITQIMRVTEEDSVKMASYRLKNIAHDWVTIWKDGRGDNATPISWQVFQNTFLDSSFLKI